MVQERGLTNRLFQEYTHTMSYLADDEKTERTRAHLASRASSWPGRGVGAVITSPPGLDGAETGRPFSSPQECLIRTTGSSESASSPRTYSVHRRVRSIHRSRRFYFQDTVVALEGRSTQARRERTVEPDCFQRVLTDASLRWAFLRSGGRG